MVRRCYVPDCSSEEGKEEHQGVTFHKIPMHPDIRPKWMSLCHIPDDKKNMKVIYVCSRHFLSADFCHFKGRKYMLRQGVLPSVFPWKKAVIKKSKLKKENSINEPAEEEKPDSVQMKKKYLVAKQESNDSEASSVKIDELNEFINEESVIKESVNEELKSELSSVDTETNINTKEEKIKSFAPNMRIEALDFNEMWYPAEIIEVDYEENEVLIHFEKYSNKYDEWICMNSSRLRPLQSLTKKKDLEKFSVGEKCMASWNDARKFPATVTKVIDDETYEIIFDDGFVKVLKAHRMAKVDAKHPQSSPLFHPVQGTKQERRDRKRKLNVAALFGKRTRTETATPPGNDNTTNQNDDGGIWTPKWENGKPVGEESTIELNDGIVKSVVVSDPRLPENWTKHLTQRIHGTSVGKWITVIISPEGKKFRTRAEVKAYLDAYPELNLSESMFDFSLHRKSRKSGETEIGFHKVSHGQGEVQTAISEVETEEESSSGLKILLIDDVYKCPIEGCGKNFRRENLAQMHVKHYHPEYTKFLDSTPNVADLAYARTVGENLEKTGATEKQKVTISKHHTPKSLSPKTTISIQRNTQSPSIEHSSEQQKQQHICQQTPNKLSQEQTTTIIAAVTENEDIEEQTLSKMKDSEILKLLNTKPSASSIAVKYPPGLPSSAYPDIKLKDLLKKSEGIPKRDDINLKSLSASTARPAGIKTLLPVARQESKKEFNQNDIEKYLEEDEENNLEDKIHHSHHGKQQIKRKRKISDSFSIHQQPNKEPKETATASVASVMGEKEVPIKEQQSNYIVEGGEVIKIVQMKREEIINCTCGVTEEDGLMIQCELCLCWQHAYCNNIERENQVPDKYVCYICQNPAKQRSSRRYYHDQDWLKHGTLAVGTYHCKDEDSLVKRFEKLKRSHDWSGALLELKDYVHTLRTKIKIAEAKNHPKLYLWSKLWEKNPLPEDFDKKDMLIKREIACSNESHTEDLKTDLAILKQRHEIHGSNSMLFSLLKNGKDENDEQKLKEEINLNNLMDASLEEGDQQTVVQSNNNVPIAPQPEAAIDSSECRLNLLDHISHSQILVERRLDNFEEVVKSLEEMEDDNDDNHIRIRHTLEMLLRDLLILQDFGQSSSL